MNANTFHLKSKHARITYAAQGNAGHPVMTYKDSTYDLTFQEANIRALSSEIGVFLTVTLQIGVDQGTKELTLLLPTVTVPDANSPVHVKGEAILTTFPKVAGINVPGPDQIYEVASLHGTAEFLFVQTAAAS
jgi:hypothetical protein